MRSRNRRNDFTLYRTEFLRALLVGSTHLVEFYDGDKLFRVTIGDRYCRGPSFGDLLDRCFYVLWIVITPMDNQQILDAADNEQLTLGDETLVAGS